VIKLVRITMAEGAFDALARIVANYRHIVSERPQVDEIRTAFDGREELDVDVKSAADALGSMDTLGPMRPLSDLPGFADLPVDSGSREEFDEEASRG